MHGRNDLRHLGHLHGSSPPSVSRPQRLPLGITIHGREILSEVGFLTDEEIPRGSVPYAPPLLTIENSHE
jgi:hypothetical protein